jgi:hypothetical protein
VTHRPDDGGSKYLWNVGKLLPDYTPLQPRRQPSSYSPPWESEILLTLLFICDYMSAHGRISFNTVNRSFDGDEKRADRITVTVFRTHNPSVRWCMAPLNPLSPKLLGRSIILWSDSFLNNTGMQEWRRHESSVLCYSFPPPSYILHSPHL